MIEKYRVTAKKCDETIFLGGRKITRQDKERESTIFFF